MKSTLLKRESSDTAVYYEIPDQSYAGGDFLPYVIQSPTPKLVPDKPKVIAGDTWWRPIAMNVRKQETGNEDLAITNISNAGFVDVIKDTPGELLLVPTLLGSKLSTSDGRSDDRLRPH